MSVEILRNNHSDKGEEDPLISARKGSNVCVEECVTLNERTCGFFSRSDKIGDFENNRRNNINQDSLFVSFPFPFARCE